MVSEAPNKLETTVGQLNLMESKAGATEGGWGDLVIPYVVVEVAKENSKFREKHKNTFSGTSNSCISSIKCTSFCHQ